ncbi:hypothetical protein [Burkholderia glumae]|uniref:Uncharacterized protein n=1 Tax=Burkholderia glumae TaxID=337 RepID=A0AAQ0BST7_BURGL|nr:hypothetical protein [Burkholderia glumae]MCM2483513.1 hypothetical protein [Burkholderia glumae]MCM2493862.1 hypothetical protein [Burkholderia glumae]MCM2511415.1 hypothetical protein [Burkholderia glumae]MCM2541294.1 hypothetical protein [Burkholderia glumae]MCM2547053.1 hypothetical protein [Burkholderia glumae]
MDHLAAESEMLGLAAAQLRVGIVQDAVLDARPAMMRIGALHQRFHAAVLQVHVRARQIVVDDSLLLGGQRCRNVFRQGRLRADPVPRCRSGLVAAAHPASRLVCLP